MLQLWWLINIKLHLGITTSTSELIQVLTAADRLRI
ncbi:unnamed protein product, partial [Brassica rapa subsp. trilocularis]